jgi:peptide/nickel transport system permease protein
VTRYILNRALQGIVALLIASLLIFFLARLTGDPIASMVGENTTPEQIEQIRTHFGLNQPLYVQYWKYISNAVTGDLGMSLLYTGRQVSDVIIARAPATLKLAGVAIVLSLGLSIPLGILSAIKRERWQDQIFKGVAMFGQAAPQFWFGIMAILLFSVKLGWLPPGGYGGFESYILPAISLTFFPMAGILRFTRSAMLDTLGSDYVRLAKIKGAPERSVVYKHAFSNAAIPVVTVIGLILPNMVMGAVVTESVFSWPGVGRLAYQAVTYRDFPMIQGITLIAVALFVIVNLLVDIVYVYLDPRVRYVKNS